MLKSLFIKNYALIDTLDIRFEKGFSVITGETGAGKSIILGAIGLLLGQRADSKTVKGDAGKCIIEARFDLSAYAMDAFFEQNDLEFDGCECIIRREVTAAGKSRAFVNDTPIQVSLLKELGEMLIDIHSQHQNLLLNKEDFQLNVIDILAGDKPERDTYSKLYSKYRQAAKALEEAETQVLKAKEDEDYLVFQLEQLEKASLKPGEQDELEQEADLLTHAEEIKQALYQADNLLENEQGGVVNALKECSTLLSRTGKVHAQSGELASRIESCYIELKDIANSISSEVERIDFDPERQAFVEERLNTIYSLQQKHHVNSCDELIAIEEDFRMKLSAIANGDERIASLKREVDEAYKALTAQAAILTARRTEAAKKVEAGMQQRLIPLGIPNVQFKVELSKREQPDDSGMDRVSFLFSANRNMPLQPITQVASGGEIARVMLSLKAMITGAVKLPTIIFDEIDTGVSGSIAEKMALIMQEMGAHDRQVISITHLPQIAARGKVHYKVYKEDNEDGTTSHIVRLSEDQRIEEIAHMLSGTNLTEAAINNAKALLSSQ